MEKKDTIIYGGSFDPIHLGHEDIINKLCERFKRVIVVPAYISPFKIDNSLASPQDRLNMLSCCKFPPNAIISDIEINAKKCSYSIDTVNAYYNGNPIYFAVGSESIRTLYKWKNADELKKKVIFYSIPRPGFSPQSCDGFAVENADFVGLDVSSSLIKVDIAFKKHLFMSDKVSEYVRDNQLYNDFCSYTKAFDIFNLKQERREHTYRAVLEGIKLAKRHDVDVQKTIIALILHDVGKYVTPESLNRLNIVAQEPDLPDGCKHAVYSKEIAKQYYNLSDDIVDAIGTHTIGGMNMDDLAKVVSLADYIEPGRTFLGVEIIRQAAYENLDVAMALMLENTMEYLKKEGKIIAPEAINVYKFFKEKNKGKRNGKN